jgi:hypothetical protein
VAQIFTSAFLSLPPPPLPLRSFTLPQLPKQASSVSLQTRYKTVTFSSEQGNLNPNQKIEFLQTL